MKYLQNIQNIISNRIAMIFFIIALFLLTFTYAYSEENPSSEKLYQTESFNSDDKTQNSDVPEMTNSATRSVTPEEIKIISNMVNISPEDAAYTTDKNILFSIRLFDGRLIRDPTDPKCPRAYDYLYGPSLIINSNRSVDAWFSSPGGVVAGVNEMDWVRYINASDPGNKNTWIWKNEKIVLTPSGSASMDKTSVCDPSVVKFGGYYYITYTSTIYSVTGGRCNQIFTARSGSPTGPWKKWNGSGWGGLPKPLIVYKENGCDCSDLNSINSYKKRNNGNVPWGVSEPSLVVKDNTLFIFYEKEGTRLATAQISDDKWPGKIGFQSETAIEKRSDEASRDVKYIPELNKFIALGVVRRYESDSRIRLWESIDGYKFKTVKEISNISNFRKAHNASLSGDESGHIKLRDKNFIIFSTENPQEACSPTYMSYMEFPGSVQEPWTKTIVDSSNVGWGVQIKLDKNGLPGIAYLNNHSSVKGTVNFAKFNGSIWVLEHNIYTSANNGAGNIALGFSSSSEPRLIFPDYPANHSYAKKNGSAWSFQTFSCLPDYFGGDLVVDSANNPHIAWYTNSRLEYRVWNGSTWQTQNVDASGDMGYSAKMVMDNSGHVNIAYGQWINGSPHRLKFAYFNGSSWSTEYVANTDNAGSQHPIALTSQGYPTILCKDVNGNYKLATKVNGTWQFKYTPLTFFNGGFEIDARNHIHIVSHQQINGKWYLMYYFYDGSAWTNTTIDQFTKYSGGSYPGAGLAIGNDGTIHIAYGNPDTWSVIYVKYRP
jgi:hypothetical protein